MSVLHLDKSVLYLGKSVLHLDKSVLHLGNSVLHLGKSVLHLDISVLHLGKSVLHLDKSELHPGKSVLHLGKSVLHLDESVTPQGLKIRWSKVRDQRLVGSDLTFSNLVKTDGPVETLQLRTWIKWVVKSLSDRCYCIILIQHWLPLLILLTLDYVKWNNSRSF